MMSKTAKQILRIEIKRQRASLSDDAKRQASQAICLRLSVLSEYQQASKIALYFAVQQEIDLSALWQNALVQGKYCYFPCLNQDLSLSFLPANEDTPLKKNIYQIPEPEVDKSLAIPLANLDLMVMPLLAFDRLGTRLGMGGGYYDRTLKDYKPSLLIGVAYTFQELTHIEREPWDVPLDLIVTPEDVLRP